MNKKNIPYCGSATGKASGAGNGSGSGRANAMAKIAMNTIMKNLKFIFFQIKILKYFNFF